MNSKLYKLMNWPEIEEIIYSDGNNPHRILGPHKVGNNLLIQVYRPEAKEVSLLFDVSGKKVPMELADEAGFYACLVSIKETGLYQVETLWNDGTVERVYDPYEFSSKIDREDCIKFNSGIHHHIEEKLGAHPTERDGVKGVSFAVWAPNAARVSVVGAFNRWDGRLCQMHRIDPNGIYEIFIPEVHIGDEYQYEIKLKSGRVFSKPDPYALKCKDHTGEISIVSDLESITWEDEKWLQERRKNAGTKTGRPLSICEITLGQYAARCKEQGENTNYRNMASMILREVLPAGFNAIELLPVMEHTNEHRYDVTGYFALKSEYGTSQDFMAFMNEMHKAGISVILDLPVTFFRRSENGLSTYDGEALYEYGDPRKGVQPGTDRLIFDYGRKQVTNYLISCALFWVNHFHADGLRLTDISKALYLDYDRAPGEWTPNIYGGNENLEATDFVRNLVHAVNKTDPGVLLITKETACYPQLTSPVEEGGLGFDFKWNNGWTKDLLGYLRNDPIYRSGHHNELTFSMIYSYTERFILTFSHEDIGGYDALKELMPGDEAQKEAGVRMAMAYMMVHPGRKMFFPGQFSQEKDKAETVMNFMASLNKLYFSHPALYQLDDVDTGFEWVNSIAADLCMLSFLRHGEKDKDRLLVVMNMAGVERNIRVGVPVDGRYHEILNTDDKKFGGLGNTNKKKIESERRPYDGRNYSIDVTLAPLSLAVFEYTPFTEEELKIRQIKEDAQLKMEQEQEAKRLSLQNKQAKEEEKLLAELRKKYEKEIAAQNEAIREKYEKIEAEKIHNVSLSLTKKKNNRKVKE